LFYSGYNGHTKMVNLKISQSIAEKKGTEDTLLYNRDEGDFFYIEGPEVLIWEMLKQNKFDKGSVIRQIMDEYEVTMEQLEYDIEIFLAELKECKIIEQQ